MCVERNKGGRRGYGEGIEGSPGRRYFKTHATVLNLSVSTGSVGLDRLVFTVPDASERAPGRAIAHGTILISLVCRQVRLTRICMAMVHDDSYLYTTKVRTGIISCRRSIQNMKPASSWATSDLV